MAWRAQLMDVCVNVGDGMFIGEYRGVQRHASDLNAMLRRARRAGVVHCLAAASHWDEMKRVKHLVGGHCLGQDSSLPQIWTACGIHPTHCQDFETDHELEDKLLEFAKKHRHDPVVAIGEFGLDSERQQFCSLDIQRKHFDVHLRIAEQLNLPLLVHDRATAGEVIQRLTRNRDRFSNAVVHSFTGSKEEVDAAVDADLHISLNGCSLRTEEGLENAKRIPIDRLLLETDSPWCGVKSTHPSHRYIQSTWPQVKRPEKLQVSDDSDFVVKDRYEPCHLRQIVEIVAAVRQIEPNVLAEHVFENSMRIFLPHINNQSLNISCHD